MAVRVFKYAIGGAIMHNMTATDSELNIKVPQPCVIFLKSGENTPKKLTWKVDFFDGQSVTLNIPTVRLAELSVKEIAERNLFPIGQFYLRTFEPLTAHKFEGFSSAGTELLTALRDSMEREVIPYHLAAEMQDNIRKIAENAINRAKKEVGFTMDTDILETLPWIDFREVFEKIEERGEARGEMRGEERGKINAQNEIALNAFKRSSVSQSIVVQFLKAAGISDEIIKSASQKAMSERSRQTRQHSDPER